MNNNYKIISFDSSITNEEYFIVFSLLDKKYAINIENVVEVINMPIIELPETMPAGIAGIFKYKGKIIRLIDLSPFLGFVTKKFNINNKVIIVSSDDELFAIHTHNIINIMPFNKADIQPIPYSAENSILKSIYKTEYTSVNIIDVYHVREIVLKNNIKQNDTNYAELLPDDPKSLEILNLRTSASDNKQEIYSFNFNLIGSNQYVLCTIDKNNYYIDLKYVKEFSSSRRYNITKLPYTEKYIKGIINFKGDFLLVLDLKSFMNPQNDSQTKNGKFIIIEGKNFNIALFVDDIKCIQSLPDIKSNSYNNELSKYIYAEFTENNILYSLLNIEKILDDERLFVNIE